MHKPLTALLFALLLSACAKSDTTTTPIAATQPAIIAETDTPAPTLTPTSTTAIDPIDVRLTAIAQTVHPQLTYGIDPSVGGTATAQARLITPTPTLPNTLVTPLIEAAQVRAGLWSPDGKWVSFWINSQSTDDPDYFLINVKPVYYEVETGRICMYDQFAGQMQMSFTNTFDYWMADGDSVVVSNGTPYVGQPCEDFIRAPDSFVEGKWNWAYSPDGRYRAETIYQEEPTTATTIVTSTATGEVVDQIEWMHGGGQWVGSGVFARWLDNSHLLFSKTYDRGSLLVEVGGDRIEVLPTFFNLELIPDVIERAWVNAALDQQSGQMHFMLTQDYKRGTLLYHTESRQVEEVPFQYASFSPDGRWLLMTNPLDTPNDYATLWIRAVDPTQSPAAIFARSGGYLIWSASADRVAYNENFPDGHFRGGVVVSTFPQNHIIVDYRHPDYNLSAMAWSPDGTKLLIQGSLKNYNPQTQGMALFIVEP